MTEQEFPLLSQINSPADLKLHPQHELRAIANEVRDFLIDRVSKVGGHLGAGLGTVELAVALHYVFNTPYDKLVWDVGHQAYPHKVLTGRRDVFHTLRQKGGISGFLKRKESIYDEFGAGHATTSISAALGMAVARDLAGEKNKVVAIIGDGSMTGGMAYEGMNNAGMQKRDLIVILNDNNMSIAPNVWAFSNYFTELISNPTYNKFKNNVWELTGKLDEFGDRIRKAVGRLQEGIKVVITPGMLFEALGFRYFGPVNGHNISNLVKLFHDIKDLKGPILVHVLTQKGKGYAPAEEDAQRLHGVNPFDKVTGISPKKVETIPAYTKVFGKAVVELALQNQKIVGITAAMPDGTGLDQLREAIPERFFDVGIAEQHAVTFAAGLATQGYIPICAIYSTFLQRAFDQIVHDIAIQHLHVIFAIDRGGVVGADGPTHHGVLDLSYLRCIQTMVIMAPKDESELRNMLFTAVEYDKGPIALRYPRGNGIGVPVSSTFEQIEIGKAEWLCKGTDINILAIGNMVYPALRAAEILAEENLSIGVINMRFVKPIDVQIIEEAVAYSPLLLTIEDNNIVGGFGAGVLEVIAEKQIHSARVKLHGIYDSFVEHATPQELYKILRFDADGIVEVIREFLEQEKLHFENNTV